MSFPKPRIGARIGRRYVCPGVGPEHTFALKSHRQEYCTPACQRESKHYRAGLLAPSKSREGATYPPRILTPIKANKNGHRIMGSGATEGAATDARASRRNGLTVVGISAPAVVIDAEVLAGRTWRPVTSDDGVPYLIAGAPR